VTRAGRRRHQDGRIITPDPCPRQSAQDAQTIDLSGNYVMPASSTSTGTSAMSWTSLRTQFYSRENVERNLEACASSCHFDGQHGQRQGTHSTSASSGQPDGHHDPCSLGRSYELQGIPPPCPATRGRSGEERVSEKDIAWLAGKKVDS
jgi:hypothetical protein